MLVEAKSAMASPTNSNDHLRGARWWSGLRERNYDTTGNNQRASEDKGHRGCLLEEEPRDQLCNDEEENDIQAEKLSKVPRRRVYSPSIREENRRGGRKQ